MTPEEKETLFVTTKLIEALEPLPHEERVECLLASIAGQLEILLKQLSLVMFAHSENVHAFRTSEMYPENFSGSDE